MPPLYRYDDFDECMGVYENKALFCVVKTHLKEDLQSELYKFIKDYSKNRKQHFRHDKLERGLCINDCQEKLKKFGTESEKYFVKKFPMNSKVK
jgi:hypothetical protein